MNKKKQQPVKRKYVKKAAKLNLVTPTPIQEQKDMEIAELTQICSIISNWTPEQRKRNLEYLAAKYYDFS